MDIVLKLRELRHHRGLSQKDVERLSGVGEKTLSSFETGERIDTMKIAQLRALLALYGVTEEEFFSDKLDEMFDPTYVRISTRLGEITARIAELPEHIRDGALDAISQMLDAMTLATTMGTRRRSSPPPVTSAMPLRHAPAA
jgi:transcriptional regulator with XRE-family HTH domain